MRIVQEYGFVPNVTATGLAGGRTRLIGVLTPPLVWPAIPEMLRGVAAYIENTSYEMVLYSISFERNHSDVLDRILSMKMISGLLAILPGELSHHLINLINRFQQGLPLVMIDDQEKPSHIPWVGVDNVASAYEATSYLLQLGHRRIAHILGPRNYYCAFERYQGYCQALQDAGLSHDPALLLEGRFDIASGRECAATLFSRDKSEWPDAIFAGNDQMAYGVLAVAEQQGIRVPDDVSVVGFDDNILSAHIRPSLTTIRQPFSDMGCKAIELLLTMIDPDHRADKEQQKGYVRQKPAGSLDEDVNTGDPIRIQLPTSLVVRASSIAPRPLSISP
jgi:LacI family transcriptional regulator